jgi:murein DD-endopeptidase MepM/ murein hydrolase activator NlpD
MKPKCLRRTCSGVRKALLGVLVAVLALSLPEFAYGQLGGFGCPMKGSPRIRQGDSIAPSGGRFNSSRGTNKTHGALDLNGKVGDPVYSSLSGRVAVSATNWGEMGNTVIVDHGSGAYTVYGHLDTISVESGAQVQKGTQLGTVGYTGNAKSLSKAGLPPHLHFALIQAGHSGLADEGKPLRRMRDWADYWQSLDIALTGPVDPILFGMSNCWTGSTTVGAPGEK